MPAALTLNERAQRIADQMAANADTLRIETHSVGAARVLDCGVKAEGGLEAGLGLARVCLADLGTVALVPGDCAGVPGLEVQVISDHPLLACMASQYAGWQVQVGKFFAMGSGPMRAAYGREELFEHISGRESPPVAVGVLETRKLPDADVIAHLAEKLQLPAEKITLLTAPTTSLAGTVQVVARSLETALHKLHELGFDLTQVVAGTGTAPLPPVAADSLSGIGRTNDAILYGGRVVLWVRADDATIAEIGAKVPSGASADHGSPFAEIFARYGQDFYKIDPMLFSPAVIVFHNLKTGRSHTFGRLAPEVLQKSFFGG
jgi:methenyltetrahydromethanopterin cyclohydrolase